MVKTVWDHDNCLPELNTERLFEKEMNVQLSTTHLQPPAPYYPRVIHGVKSSSGALGGGPPSVNQTLDPSLICVLTQQGCNIQFTSECQIVPFSLPTKGFSQPCSWPEPCASASLVIPLRSALLLLEHPWYAVRGSCAFGNRKPSDSGPINDHCRRDVQKARSWSQVPPVVPEQSSTMKRERLTTLQKDNVFEARRWRQNSQATISHSSAPQLSSAAVRRASSRSSSVGMTPPPIHRGGACLLRSASSPTSTARSSLSTP